MPSRPMIRRLFMALLVPLALIAAEPTSPAPHGRIAIREGKEGHSTFSPGSYDELWANAPEGRKRFHIILKMNAM
jgi:hypothetical protein